MAHRRYRMDTMASCCHPGAATPTEGEKRPMNAPERMRAIMAEPGFIVVPAICDGHTAKLTAEAAFKTVFLSGSCVAARRLGGRDLDLLSFRELFDALVVACDAAPDLLLPADADHGYGNAMNVLRPSAPMAGPAPPRPSARKRSRPTL